MNNTTCTVINRDKFYNSIRPLFGGKLTQSQVEGMNAILTEWERRKLTDVRWLAYIMATVLHETAATMQPIHERGGKAYFFRMYDMAGSRPDVAQRLGNTWPGDGVKYAGRGHTQNTGRGNYARLTKANTRGWNFVDNPDLLLQTEPSIWATFYSMITGLYTGKKLGDYLNETKQDWLNCRRVVNGLDKAEKIADYAKEFYKGLT